MIKVHTVRIRLFLAGIITYFSLCKMFQVFYEQHNVRRKFIWNIQTNNFLHIFKIRNSFSVLLFLRWTFSVANALISTISSTKGQTKIKKTSFDMVSSSNPCIENRYIDKIFEIFLEINNGKKIVGMVKIKFSKLFGMCWIKLNDRYNTVNQ